MVSARNMNVQITQVVHGASSAGRNSTAVRALRVTINEVAAHADVSRQTVSNTLNYPDRVRPATLQRVRESIDLLGYRPSAPSQQLRRQRSGAVGFELNALGSALNEVAHPFLVALSVATAQYGCHLVPFASGDARPALDGYIDTVQRHLVDAFVIVDTHPMDPRPAWLSQRAIPWVAFGRVWDDETLTNWADVDGRAGTAAAVDHLVERGYETIGYLGWPVGSAGGRLRPPDAASTRHLRRSANKTSLRRLPRLDRSSIASAAVALSCARLTCWQSASSMLPSPVDGTSALTSDSSASTGPVPHRCAASPRSCNRSSVLLTTASRWSTTCWTAHQRQRPGRCSNRSSSPAPLLTAPRKAFHETPDLNPHSTRDHHRTAPCRLRQ